jgi:hypothetical protein
VLAGRTWPAQATENGERSEPYTAVTNRRDTDEFSPLANDHELGEVLEILHGLGIGHVNP